MSVCGVECARLKARLTAGHGAGPKSVAHESREDKYQGQKPKTVAAGAAVVGEQAGGRKEPMGWRRAGGGVGVRLESDDHR